MTRGDCRTILTLANKKRKFMAILDLTNELPRVGGKYYVCYADFAATPPEPVVETLVYLGYKEMEMTSESCDKPYYFYVFTHFKHEYPPVLDPTLLILVPSRRQLARYSSFFGFMQRLREVISQLEENDGFELPKEFLFLRLQ